MTTTMNDRDAAIAKIEFQKQMCKDGHSFLMSTFAAMPDDKAAWKPTPSAKSALEIVAHVAAANQYFILAYQGNPPETALPAIFKWIDKQAAQWTTRSQVEKELERTHKELDEIFARLTPEILENPRAQTGLWVSSFHAFEHSSQLDYIQTCYGDKEYHMPLG